MNKENKDPDPDYVFFDRNKSHNSAYYKQTPGVCTNTKMELRRILRTTNSPPSSNNNIPENTSNNNLPENSMPVKDRYWVDPRDVLRNYGGHHDLIGEREHIPDLHGERELSPDLLGVGQGEVAGGVDLFEVRDVGHNSLGVGEGGDVLIGVRAGGDDFGARDGGQDFGMRDGGHGDDFGVREGGHDFGVRVGGQDFVVRDTGHGHDYGVREGGVKKKKRKKKNKGTKFDRHKMGNLSRYSHREIEREIDRNSKMFNEKIRVESLKQTLGDPWDGISFDEKKHFALHFYYTHLQV